ncbi:MAG: hypothetical protein IKP77_00225 [Acholeplasmatales bacterium]|nr:hypothetical protein [Acholeplasmatales bacterium]
MMKKTIGSIILLLFISFIFFGYKVNAASTWKYVWNNTTITIPVGESFDKYMDMPVATLYRDGYPLNDANITYNTEGDWLYYSKNVDTTHCGVYKVWYKCFDNKYIPGTCTGYKCLVTFYVKDLEAPNLEILEDEVSIKRGSTYDFKNNVSYSDNYSSLVTLDFSSSFDPNILGTYKVNVKATDEGGNVTTKSFNVNVYDDSVPIIECSKEGGDIYIPVGEEYNIKEFFKATDLFDGDISGRLEFPSIDYKVVGVFPYEVTVTNSSGKKASFNATVHIVDNMEPVINLTEESIILDYKIDIDNFDFKKYISKIDDNQGIDYNNLKIKTDLKNEVGNYKVWYEYTDGVYVVNNVLDVSLISHESPKMTIESVVLDIDSSPDLYQYVSITDESDKNVYDTLYIDDSNVIYEKEGIYYANAYCINSSGLSTEKRMKIVVKGNDVFSEANKGFSITAIVLAFMVVGLLIFIISYILITRKDKFSEKKNDLNI